ncbi:MAG: Ppx/GppA phosphatase family protein [Alphaproteobacteria bacterium]
MKEREGGALAVVQPRFAAHRRRRRGRPYAAIDLGTNNCRLLVAAPERDGFRVIDAFSRIVRLGEGLRASGRLSDAAMDRTIAALRICADKIRRNRSRQVRAIATEACRRAGNGQAFLDRVAVETGLGFEVISPQEEAALARDGCLSLAEPGKSRMLVFDIGGGSTEISWVAVDGGGCQPLGWTSLPLGVVTLSEDHGGNVVARPEFERMIALVAERLAQFEAAHGIGAAIARGEVQVVGTSGTVTTLAGLHLGLPAYDRRRVDGTQLDYQATERVCERLLALDARGRAALPCVGPERADLVLAGCAILLAIQRQWPAGRLHVADRGLREGMLLRMIAADRGPRSGHTPPS